MVVQINFCDKTATPKTSRFLIFARLRGQVSQVHKKAVSFIVELFFQYTFIFIKRFSTIINKKDRARK